MKKTAQKIAISGTAFVAFYVTLLMETAAWGQVPQQPPVPTNFAVLRGTLKADKRVVRDGESITFTYSVTNTGKAAQTLDFSSGQRFDMTVSAKGSATPLWQMSATLRYMMMLGRLPFAPGETKTFTATWTPNKGTAKPGGTFTAAAYLTPRITNSTGTPPHPARASLTLLAAHK